MLARGACAGYPLSALRTIHSPREDAPIRDPDSEEAIRQGLATGHAAGAIPADVTLDGERP